MRIYAFFASYPALKKIYNTKQCEFEIYNRRLNRTPHDNARRAALLAEITELESRLGEIRDALDTYQSDNLSPNGSHREAKRLLDERMFIECHFINGLTMEQSAEAMEISRDTVFRISRRVKAR